MPPSFSMKNGKRCPCQCSCCISCWTVLLRGTIS